MVSHAAATDVLPPDPISPVPSSRQLAWHELEFYGFIHFTINTFTNKEWGYGDESPDLFAPTELDVTQWVQVAKDAGMKGLILTCKHHDGFCLWPSAYTDHSVKNSPYKDGQGDVVGELAAACREAGLKFGVYLSPWDRNHPEYGRPAYIDYFRNQLRELLTNYGDVFEVWFDGANGGDGYYGGAREERHIDRTSYYGWPDTWGLVRELMPNAVMFSDVGPDIRWVGNESGYAGDPCWATYTPKGRDGQPPAPGLTQYEEGVNGHADGELWLPAEVDVSIRPGWFYHAKEDRKVRTPENLLQIYYESVGRGTSLLLNLPPDRRGLIHENDVAALQGMRKLLDQIFDKDLARNTKATSEHVRGNAPTYAAQNLLDGDRTTYWSTDDAIIQASVEIDLGEPKTFDHVIIQEYIELGQRVLAFNVEAQVDGQWKEVAKGTSIGWKRILKFDPVSSRHLRLNILDAKACPTIGSLEVY
jgi:alpha-L-fucosidase